jgi:hypothetical protein
MRLLDQRRDVRVEQRVMALQQGRFRRRRAIPTLRRRVMPGQLLLRIAHADQTGMTATSCSRADPEFAGIQIDLSVLPTQRSGTE